MLNVLRSRRPAGTLLPPELPLISITMIWGATFPIIHIAMAHSGAMFFVGLRFLTAGLAALVVFRRHLAGTRPREVKAGLIIGLAMYAGYGMQTYGLTTISGSKSAFITALYVPMVPLLQWLVLRRLPRLMSWIGIILAFTGLVLLANPDASGIILGKGEIVTLISVIPIAAEILLIGHFAPSVNTKRLTTIQLLVVAALSFLTMPISGETIPAMSWLWAVPAVALGLSTTLIQAVINWAQTTISPTRATVIYAGEPVWGGVFGRIAGDRLGLLAILGAGLILAGVLVSELGPRLMRPRHSSQNNE